MKICADCFDDIDFKTRIQSLNRRAICDIHKKKEYVFEGYEVQAIRYLLKPLQYEQMKPVLTKIQDSRNKEKKHVIVASGGESHKIYQKDIRYIEAVGHYMHIVTKEEEYSCKMTLSSIYKSLDVDQFIYTHRSYIVNLSYLLQIKKTECLLEGGKIVPVSRSLYKEVNQAFIRFYKDGMQL